MREDLRDSAGEELEDRQGAAAAARVYGVDCSGGSGGWIRCGISGIADVRWISHGD
jgi:hypothetical protein